MQEENVKLLKLRFESLSEKIAAIKLIDIIKLSAVLKEIGDTNSSLHPPLMALTWNMLRGDEHEKNRAESIYETLGNLQNNIEVLQNAPASSISGAAIKLFEATITAENALRDFLTHFEPVEQNNPLQMS